MNVSHAPPARQPRTAGTIRVIDDSADLSRQLARSVRSARLSVEWRQSLDGIERFESTIPAACFIVDVTTTAAQGLSLRELAASPDSRPVIVLSSAADLREVVELVAAGAFAFLEKPVRMTELVAQVRRAIDVDRTNRQQAARRVEATARLSRLTEKEREVLERILAGQTNKRMAAELGLSIRAIEDRRARLMRKLNARSVAELIRQSIAAEAH